MSRLRILAVLGLLAIAAAAGAVATFGIGAQSGSGEVEVRIAARKQASGRIEIGIQQRSPLGVWGMPILPGARFLSPGDVPVGAWRYGSPVTLNAAPAGDHPAVDSSDAVPAQAEDAAAPTAPDGFTPYVVEGDEPVAVNGYAVRTFDRGQGLASTVQARPGGGMYEAASRADYIAIGTSCLPGIGIDFVLANFSGFAGSDAPTARVAWSVDRAAPTVEDWQVWAQFGTVHISPSADRGFLAALRDGERLYVTVWAPTAVHQVSFDLDGLFETPAQGNIDYCGQY